MIYVASRVKHAEMWKDFRLTYPIISTWIDEAGEGETEDLGELWTRIYAEIDKASAIVLHVAPGDCPLKGALIEAGMGIAIGKPVFVSAAGVQLEPRSFRPIGSWLNHPKVQLDQGDGAIERCLAKAAGFFGK